MMAWLVPALLYFGVIGAIFLWLHLDVNAVIASAQASEAVIVSEASVADEAPERKPFLLLRQYRGKPGGSERAQNAVQAGRGNGPYEVLEASPSATGAVRFFPFRMEGTEIRGAGAEARRHVPAMNQRDFPEPESGCGPTAVLNWMLWMQDQHLLGTPRETHGLEARALAGFQRIEEEIRRLRGTEAGGSRGGSNEFEIISAMDRLAYQLSSGDVRMAYRRFHAPLKMAEVLEFTTGYRSGILIGRVVEDRATGQLGEYHALNLVAGDRSGYLMVNNWGERVYGALRTEPDGQYFYASTADHPPIKVERALCFVPFRPATQRVVLSLERESLVAFPGEAVDRTEQASRWGAPPR